MFSSEQIRATQTTGRNTKKNNYVCLCIHGPPVKGHVRQDAITFPWKKLDQTLHPILAPRCENLAHQVASQHAGYWGIITDRTRARPQQP